MNIIFKPSGMKIRHQTRWIILHNTSEIYGNPPAQIDNLRPQIKYLSNDVLMRGELDLNYHFLLEKIDQEYYVSMGRPMTYICDWDDIHPDINNKALHIGFVGSYNLQAPTKRFYDVLAYRLLNPLLKLLNII